MATSPSVRTLEDLERTVRAIATEFKADKIFIIGAKSILLAWPDAPPVMRTSPEIDVFPDNAKVWEVQEKAKTRMNSRRRRSISMPCSGAVRCSTKHTTFTSTAWTNTATLPAGWGPGLSSDAWMSAKNGDCGCAVSGGHHCVKARALGRQGQVIHRSGSFCSTAGCEPYRRKNTAERFRPCNRGPSLRLFHNLTRTDGGGRHWSGGHP
jgi:hypothetical protein